MCKRAALIFGVAGQDGAYLARYLLDRGYEVHGCTRWDSLVDAGSVLSRFAYLGIADDAVTMHYGDVCDAHYVLRLVGAVQPDEIYNLAALSHVACSFDTPSVALDGVTRGTLNILESVRSVGREKGLGSVRFYQASSSEMFGDSPPPHREDTPFAPRSPYAIAKVAAYHFVRMYRQSYGLFAVNGILFNHESPLRAHDFVTQKIAQAAARISEGEQEVLTLGNLNAARDWGHASDYVRGMHAMLSADQPSDYVLASGVSYTVRQCVECAFAHVGMALTWRGKGVHEVGFDARGCVRVRVDAALFRPLDVPDLCGDASWAEACLGWRSVISFEDLMAEMVDAALSVSACDEGGGVHNLKVAING